MDPQRTRLAKLTEWIRRYLPCEIAGTTVEFGGAALVYWSTGSLAAAAVAGTVGASVGYYAMAYTAAVGCFHRADKTRVGLRRGVVAALLAARSLLIEFGAAEAIDSLLVRPLAFYIGPILLGSTAAGWIAAKIFSDIIFYLCTICSYERFGVLLAHRDTIEEQTQDASADPVTAGLDELIELTTPIAVSTYGGLQEHTLGDTMTFAFEDSEPIGETEEIRKQLAVYEAGEHGHEINRGHALGGSEGSTDGQ
jgi:hypothetical protein